MPRAARLLALRRGQVQASPRSVPYASARAALAPICDPPPVADRVLGDDDATSDGDATVAEQLGDDPTSDECMDGFRQILESAEVPEGESEDGIDEDELRRARPR